MSKRRNTFSRAIRQLKSEEIDKKIQLTETLPTNNTMGVFISMPPGAVVSTVTVQRDVVGEADLDFATDGESDGTDTTGLFETDGTPSTAMPPNGDTSYILGPMSAMYYSWWSGGTTTIGYIRQSDRKMVNLGTISGTLDQWDGSTVNSYGQLTLEHAVWFRDVKKKDNAGNHPSAANYRAFYPGPPSNSPDAQGRYLCTITGQPKDTTTTQNVEVPHSPTEKGAMSADDNFSAQEKGKKKPKPDRDDYPPSRAGAKKYQDDLNKWKDEQKEEGEEKPDSKKPDKEPSDYKSPKDRGGQGDNDQEWRDKGDKTGDPASDSASDSASDYKSPKDRGGQGDTDGVDPNEPGLLDKAKEAWDWYGDNKEAVDAAAGEVMNAVDAAMAIASVVGVIFPEAGTSVAGALGIASLTSKMKKAYNAVKAGKSVADVIGGKNKGLSGAGSFDVGATGVKKGGFDALNPNQVGPTAQHTGSKGILSPGGGMVYSAPKVGQTGPSAINPGSGASKYTQYGSNPFSQSSKGGGNTGGVIGSVVNKGNKSIGAIEPQSTQTPAQFNKSSKLFNDIMNGKYQNSPTAQKIYQKGIDAGFTTGGGSIKFSDIPKQTSVPNVGKTQGNLSKFVSTKGKIKESFNYLIENNSKKEIKLQGDKEDIMIMHLLKKPEILKKLPLIIKGLEQETELSDVYGAMFGFEGGNIKESLSEAKASRVLKNLKKPVVLPEGKKKSYKVKPGARMRGMDKLVGDIKPQQSYKEPQKIWSKNSQGYNERTSQEKKNQVLQYVGASMDHWDYMTDTVKKQGGKIMSNYKDHDYLYDYWLGGTRKKAVRKEEVKGDYVIFLDDKSSILQSSYNEKVEQEKEKEMFDEYYKLNPKNEPIPYENDPLFKKVSKRLKPVIDYPEKPAKKGYPNEPPPKMVNGWHPEYGKRYKYDKLDPVSAKAMPPTGNPEIDANVEKTKVKPK